MRKKNRIKQLILLFVISLCIVLGILTGSPYLKARLVMGLLTNYEKAINQTDIEIYIPTDQLDWFPQMVWFDASAGFNQRYQTNIDLTVLYSFGNFKNGRSTIFDETSPYFSSFYGAYLIHDTSTGYPRDLDQLANIPTYDYERLILRDLGDPNYKNSFDYKITTTQDSISYLSMEGWQKIDLDIETHGLWHNPVNSLSHYIQFGEPKHNDKAHEFENVSLKGRLYFKKLDGENSVALYIIAHDMKLLDETDKRLLSHTRLELKH